MEEGEVGGLREAGPENAVIDHGEVERRNEEVVGAVVGAGDLLRRREHNASGDDFDSPAHLGLGPLILMVMIRIELHFHIQLIKEEEGQTRAERAWYL